MRGLPGLYGSGYCMPALRAYELSAAASGAADDALFDLLAAAVATSGENLADARRSLAQRLVITESLWID